MDFVSAHQGAIPASAMSAQGQFEHPLVRRAKLEISAACHAAAKVPSHSVVTEFRHVKAIQQAAATRGARVRLHAHVEHPPVAGAADRRNLRADRGRARRGDRDHQRRQAAQWAPIRHRDLLHDRASYRYYWQVIERARRTGQPLPAEAEQAWFGEAAT